ncbi:MAG TPA: hypothetical protein VMD30_04010 [Tepidisphaeraceae bacterium]|nr:hypothetical protein [Tepidisphaeraceae bacterium]
MTKVRIRRITVKTRWQLVTFCGKAGGESAGIVDLLAVRKYHGKPRRDLGRGDTFQIVLIQVKGGRAGMPTANDWTRLRAVAKWHRATGILLAVWIKGREVRFFEPKGNRVKGRLKFREVADLHTIFH